MNALENETDLAVNDEQSEIPLKDISQELENNINNCNDNDEIIIETGTYKLHNITLTKNITFQGNGNPKDIIIDGENKSSIFLIQNDNVYVTFKNLTFINAFTEGFGGAISMETGHVFVDNCNFINNTAGVNAGGISNYGTEEHRGELLVNNSLFINNHAGHDGGAVTTCYASSNILNSVFIANSAHRDGGAIRVSVYGYGTVKNCIFMYNHADEWGGAYYSWASNSNIDQCIFMNNTAGTNGGAVMISGNMTLTNSIIVNNTSNETGGSFYIQQPMFNATTVMNINNNLITNNSSPYGKEIFINWKTTKLLFTKFNNNDWGDEDPNDSNIIDPDNVTKRSKVTSTIKSNLLNILNLDLLNRYSDLLKDYFPTGYFDSDDENDINSNTNTSENENQIAAFSKTNSSKIESKKMANEKTENKSNAISVNSTKISSFNSNDIVETNGSSDIGLNSRDTKKAYEIIKHTPSKSINSINIGFILFILIALIAFVIGYKRKENHFE